MRPPLAAHFSSISVVTGLGTLDGVAETSVPGDVGHAAKSSADTEQDGVVVPLAETVVPLDDTGLRIYVRPGVLGFAVFGQDARGSLEDH